MNNMIHKYILEFKSLQAVTISRGADILDVQVQGNELVMWAIVDVSKEAEIRYIEIVGTGHVLNTNYTRKHIATVQDSYTVWHVFERFS